MAIDIQITKCRGHRPSHCELYNVHVLTALELTCGLSCKCAPWWCQPLIHTHHHLIMHNEARLPMRRGMAKLLIRHLYFCPWSIAPLIYFQMTLLPLYIFMGKCYCLHTSAYFAWDLSSCLLHELHCDLQRLL